MALYDMGSGETGMSAAADGQAFYELACLYASGRSVQPDLVSAHKWFNVSAARGCREAIARRSELATEMTAAEVARAQREARLFLSLN